ncbi:MAG: hypothetical protein JF593_13125 [Novosphingobium sp.]|nr:hypothetical protein [Novosphingobium sp.]
MVSPGQQLIGFVLVQLARVVMVLVLAPIVPFAVTGWLVRRFRTAYVRPQLDTRGAPPAGTLSLSSH